jgi:hypothetical protein
VKVSSVCSQLTVAAFEHEVKRVAERLRRLYDEALRHHPPKFVNLDMEEYSDLDLTVAVFKRVLSEARYARLAAGIVLQAYIPDSDPVLLDLLAWARDRHRSHGGAVKIRLVKGANLAMERVEAELAGWPLAPFATKAQVDANYKRMLDVLLDPANAAALRVGVGTHNLFEAAWALTVAADRGLQDMLEMEMLEGMAPSIAESVRRQAGRPPALRADSPPGRQRVGHRLPGAPLRREHRPGELTAPPVLTAAGYPHRGPGARSLPGRRARPRGSGAADPPHPGPRPGGGGCGTGGRRSCGFPV